MLLVEVRSWFEESPEDITASSVMIAVMVDFWGLRSHAGVAGAQRAVRELRACARRH